MAGDRISTHQKALAINLEPKIYGSIAEIGAGQEVSRWFFQVGGAAGTIAKTISAYDMTVSDQIYGKGTRYVSRERVQAMLEREYEGLVSRLGETRGKETAFFVFADTVSARNYAGTNECHGWLGVRYQSAPGGAPADILLHVNMRDSSNQLQQEALGVLGVNLIYGVFFRRGWTGEFLSGLFEGVTRGRLEIDAIYYSGPEEVPAPAELGMQLIERGMCEAVLLAKPGTLVPPTEAFHNRPIVLLRSDAERARGGGILGQLLREGVEELEREREGKTKPPVAVLEVSASGPEPGPALAAIREHLPAAFGVNEHVLITAYRESYLLGRYIRRYAPVEPIRFVLGSSSLVLLFEERYYADVPGRILEALGRLFADNVRLYVKPMPRKDFEALIRGAGAKPPTIVGSNDVVGLEDLKFEPPLEHLFRYLCSIEALVTL